MNMTYGELEVAMSDVAEGSYVTERQIIELENRIKKLGDIDTSEVANIIQLLRQLLFKAQAVFQEREQAILAGKQED